MTSVRLACVKSPDAPKNEDFGFAVPGLVGVLDGVTVPPGLETGCEHGPAWYVGRLAAGIVGGWVTDRDSSLVDLLASAIATVAGEHGGRCDLSHPGTPASTVCLLRHGADTAEYLVLCDSPLVYERDGRVEVVADRRVADVGRAVRRRAADSGPAAESADPAARFRNAVTAQRGYLNRPDGYWIAAAEPGAASHALTGTLPLVGAQPVTRAALVTDGASRAVDMFGLCDWRGLLDILSADGPDQLIERVRSAERQDPSGRSAPRYKRHDDATAALITFTGWTVGAGAG
jgi:hypothetical protein